MWVRPREPTYDRASPGSSGTLRTGARRVATTRTAAPLTTTTDTDDAGDTADPEPAAWMRTSHRLMPQHP